MCSLLSCRSYNVDYRNYSRSWTHIVPIPKRENTLSQSRVNVDSAYGPALRPPASDCCWYFFQCCVEIAVKINTFVFLREWMSIFIQIHPKNQNKYGEKQTGVSWLTCCPDTSSLTLKIIYADISLYIPRLPPELRIKTIYKYLAVDIFRNTTVPPPPSRRVKLHLPDQCSNF